MAEPEPNWRSKWDEDCPLTIGVALQNWEQWSDTALRDELKRIRDTGFTAVRVHFDRDNDIEKMAGMLNWRNPDRFFDAAEQAGLKVWCAPGNLPHRSLDPRQSLDISSDIENWEDSALADTVRWIQRFCRQYRSHPALLAWLMQLDSYFWYDVGNEEISKEILDQWRLLLRAFQDATPEHPVLTLHPYFPDEPRLFVTEGIGMADSSALFGIPSLFPERGTPFYIEWDRSFYATSQQSTDIAASTFSVLYNIEGGSTNDLMQPFTMTSGKMQRILLIALAAGFKSVVFDKWKPNTNTNHVGQSGFVDWLDRVTPAAQAAGHIALLAEHYHQELWHLRAASHVHILLTPGSEYELRIGATQALLNANVPFAFVTESSLMNDTSPLAPVLFLPGSESISETLLAKLKTLVENGTRLVTEVPTGYFNDREELLNTRPGSPFEQLFGVGIAGMFYGEPPNPKDTRVSSQLRAQIVTTTARAGGGSGEVPAFTENRVGKGRALLINLPLSRIIYYDNLPNAQLSLLSYILGSRQTELPGLTGCLQFRRQSQNAEHIFLLNDSAQERTVSVSVAPSFPNVTDVLADTTLAVTEGNVSVTVPAGSGVWLRLSASG